MNIGDKFTMTSNSGQSDVYISKIENYSTLPEDIWFKYEEYEKNRPIIHPDTRLLVNGDFVLPEGMVHRVMTSRKTTNNTNMEEDKENNENPKNLFEKLKEIVEGGEPAISVPGTTAVVDSVSSHYADCNTVYKTTLGDPRNNELPIYLGVNKSESKFYFGLDDEPPLILDEKQFSFFVSSCNTLLKASIMDQFGLKNEEAFEKRIAKTEKKTGKPVLGVGRASTNEEIAKVKKDPSTKDIRSKEEIEGSEELVSIDSEDKEIVTDEDGEVISLSSIVNKLQKLDESEKIAKEQDDTEKLSEIQKSMEDMSQIIDSLSDEEKEELSREMAKKKEEAIFKKSKEFEKQLLGEIEIEGEINYNFEHFKKIFDKEGMAGLREELAKIPKEERDEMIIKITEDYKANKLKKQK